MSKCGISVSDKRFYAFMGAIGAGAVAFVTAAVVGYKAFEHYCRLSAEENLYENE